MMGDPSLPSKLKTLHTQQQQSRNVDFTSLHTQQQKHKTVNFSTLHSVQPSQYNQQKQLQHYQQQERSSSQQQLTDQDLESVLLIYDSIKSLRKGGGGGGRVVVNNFHDQVENCVKRLETNLSELYGYIQTVNPDLALIVQGLHEATQHLITSYSNTLTMAQTKLKNAEVEAQDILLAAEVIEKEKVAISMKYKALQAQFDEYKQERERKWNERERMYEDNVKDNNDNHNVQEKVEQDYSRSNSRTKWRQQQQQQPQQQLLLLQQPQQQPQPSPQQHQLLQQPQPPQKQQQQQQRTRSPSPPLSASNNSLEKQGHTSFSPQHIQRNLTLRQLQDIITDIYNSKSKADTKALEIRQPRETMEQHLYTFLNQKYGLRSLILDWVQAIISAVARYTEEDNDVAVFGRILQNDVDEGFRFVQLQIKETVEELLRVYLRSKFPTKVETAISQMLLKRMNSYIAEEEWSEVIKYMYNEEDSHYLISIVQRHAEKNNDIPTLTTGEEFYKYNSNNNNNNNRILFTNFMKILLDFQLQGHERFLSKFKSLFKLFDKNLDGSISVEQFKNLVRMLAPEKSDRELNLLVGSVDPYNAGRLTFSECVASLSQELMRLLVETRDRDVPQ